MRTDSERIAAIETEVMNIKAALLGNGQPGKISEIEKRILYLENFRYWVMGLGVGAGIACGLGMKALLEAVIR